MKEFDIIDNYFYKLVAKEESLNLQDDCAVFKSDSQIIVNVDTIVENEHFFSNDPASSVATKLLNVNLSDIASMGANPKYWTMAISIPKTSIPKNSTTKNSNSKNLTSDNSIPKTRLVNESWLAEFCDTLQEIQNKHNFHLISGDTTFTTGSLTITANVFGEIPLNKSVLKKATAKSGDVLCVSGFIGDSYWGLQLLKDRQSVSLASEQDAQYLIQKYLYPQARVALGQILINYANACTDVSDGLWADVEKMCRFSKVLGVLDVNLIPISKAVEGISGIDFDEKIIRSICGGDDYELVFSISKENLEKLQPILTQNNMFIKQIGYVEELKGDVKEAGNLAGKFIQFFNKGKEVHTKKTGYNY